MNNDNLKISLTELDLGHISLPAMTQPVLTQLAVPGLGDNLRGFDLDQSTNIVRKLIKRTAIDFAALGLELLWVKINLGHGKFYPWLKEVGMSPDKAQRFMRAGKAFMNKCEIEFDKKDGENKRQYRVRAKTILSCATTTALRNPMLTQDFEYDVWGNKPKQVSGKVTNISLFAEYLNWVTYVAKNWENWAEDARKNAINDLKNTIDGCKNYLEELEKRSPPLTSVATDVDLDQRLGGPNGLIRILVK